MKGYLCTMANYQSRIFTILCALGVLIGTSFTFQACSTDFDVYAPEKEVRVVYCVLNQSDSAQYIRVAKAFQFEGDAFAFARDNDLSLHNLNIRISGNGVVYQAFPIDSVPKVDGIFYPWHTIYKFYTDSLGPGREKLIAGGTYTLEIGTADAADYVVGVTTLPSIPGITGELKIQAGAGSTRCLPRLSLDRDLDVQWNRGTGAGFEMRLFFNYMGNGVPHEITFGPTQLFSGNKGCSSGNNSLCYSFPERSLINFFKGQMLLEASSPYTYDTQDSCIIPPVPLSELPSSLVFEVTSVDSALANYMNANNPAFLDLTGAKPEYTNLSGNIDAYGVFGSICIDRKAAILRDCSEWLLRLNNRARPAGCIE
jgi:hypothetical protein